MHTPDETTRLQVKRLAAAGLTQERAARFMGLAKNTFLKHYREEFETGLDHVVEKLFNKSYENALEDNQTSTNDRQFILKTRGGFKETAVQETHIKELPKEIKWTVKKLLK
jgi:hypothetical protein